MYIPTHDDSVRIVQPCLNEWNGYAFVECQWGIGPCGTQDLSGNSARCVWSADSSRSRECHGLHRDGPWIRDHLLSSQSPHTIRMVPKVPSQAKWARPSL